MYDRRINGDVLEFGHAGILYKNSFVMYDRKTNSLWVHVTGRAEHGPRRGDQLTFIPSTVTTWERWKQSYPNTLVLPGHRRGGFMGTYEGISPGVLDSFFGSSLGLSVVVKFKAKLYPFSKLEKENVVNDHFNGTDLVVFYSTRSKTASAWNRKVGKQQLTFQLSDETDEFGNFLLQDEQTKSLWSWLSGEAVEGTLKGQTLEQVAYNPILNNRFSAFYPQAPIFD